MSGYFELGQIVRHRLNEKRMIVTRRIVAYGGDADEYDCEWFGSDGEPREARFRYTSLLADSRSPSDGHQASPAAPPEKETTR